MGSWALSVPTSLARDFKSRSLCFAAMKCFWTSSRTRSLRASAARAFSLPFTLIAGSWHSGLTIIRDFLLIANEVVE